MKRVVKVGGRAQGDPALTKAIADAAAAGDSICVVHGGGDEVSDLQRRLGLAPVFIGGRRVTSEADLAIVRMVLSGAANKRLVSGLISVGARAVGISGEDAALFRARVTDPRMGRVGSQVSVNGALIETLLAAGFLPVVSPLARDADDPSGGGLNVNGDDAAAALAVAIGADDLVLVADVPGLLDHGTLVRTADLDDIRRLVDAGVATGGMTAKLDAARSAVMAGVASVRIAGVTGIADVNVGTRITNLPSTVR